VEQPRLWHSGRLSAGAGEECGTVPTASPGFGNPFPSFQRRVRRRAASKGTVGCLLEKQLWGFNKLLLDQLFVPAPLCRGAVTESVGSSRLLKQTLFQLFTGTDTCHV